MFEMDKACKFEGYTSKSIIIFLKNIIENNS